MDSEGINAVLNKPCDVIELQARAAKTAGDRESEEADAANRSETAAVADADRAA